MTEKVQRIVWVLQAREALTEILEYRYSKIPAAYEIVKREIINASKNIVFSEQYQQDGLIFSHILNTQTCKIENSCRFFYARKFLSE